MGRARNGQAVSDERRTPSEIRRLREFIAETQASQDLDSWRRGQCVLRYIEGETAANIARAVGMHRTAITKWLRWFDVDGIEGLRTRVNAGRSPRLSMEQRQEVARVVEAGPQAAGFRSGVWTGALVGEWIRERFGVEYHPQHIPRMLHQLGFSVQRPRKRLARADLKAQGLWLRKALPAIKKKQPPAEA
jgi:transposase